MSQNNNIEQKEPERNREQQLLLIIKVLKILDKLPEGLFHEKELEVDVTVKERINLEKEAEVKLITGTRKEEGNGHEFISHKNRKNSNTQDHPNGKINEIPIDNAQISTGNEITDGEIVKVHNKKYGGMEDELGKGLQLKSKDELIGKDGNFRSRRIHKTKLNNKVSDKSKDEQTHDTRNSLLDQKELGND
ncbi:hypothetical protein RhiirA4_543712 [Rhizophagus irregularis]|uniref:Uncharacterized protein n=1 Tax=Rhizophagus irregularis TaxID=588596 RepID=A0A2I1GK78_9GLOM|nr:hypothetical protein RhiirA4_543712 [Rhizophagus irregularis]